ncbi:MAG: hypothetical protein FWC34_08900 [Bacteroidetes bacterium]|nr:hypothetical protein [Bacteroidota bacterium]MCL2303467.1 hypothetical protein [Lentimicrobiaceae bacterium]
MRKIVIILSIFALIASSCRYATKKQTGNENNSVCQQDTLIKLSETHGILYLRYDKEMELWYEPHIVYFSKNDTLKIQDFFIENGSDLYVNVSPNKKYAVIDNIAKGYVEGVEEKILHEIYFCVIIDIENAKVIETMQSDCSGEWDKDNNWVSGDKIIFSSTGTIQNETQYLHSAENFLKQLMNGKKLQLFFSDNWTFIYHKDNRCDGSTDGEKANLSPFEIDKILKLKVKNDGDGWACEKKEPTEFYLNFKLKEQVENWSRFEIPNYENQGKNGIVHIVGDGESDYLVLHYDNNNLIVKMEYRSEDPG